MKQSMFEIRSQIALTDNVYKMVLAGDTSAITAPGQFVNIRLEGFFLRRPISVCDYDDATLTIIYKVVGHGTELMSRRCGRSSHVTPRQRSGGTGQNCLRNSGLQHRPGGVL